jgi:hypothetical protein
VILRILQHARLALAKILLQVYVQYEYLQINKHKTTIKGVPAKVCLFLYIMASELHILQILFPLHKNKGVLCRVGPS